MNCNECEHYIPFTSEGLARFYACRLPSCEQYEEKQKSKREGENQND